MADAPADDVIFITVPANERIGCKNEKDSLEINKKALKMQETRKNCTLVDSELKLQLTAENVYNLSIVPEDVESIAGRYGWQCIGSCFLPFIMRTINSERFKFVSVRMAETELLKKYMQYMKTDIYTCTSVRSYFITRSEAKLLNEINFKHSDQVYGKDRFNTEIEWIIRIEDLHAFYLFIEVCYKRLIGKLTPGNEKCGFIRINSESVVSYCVKNDVQYVPLFFFEGETGELRDRAITLEHWDIAYLKFCCKVQGIRKEFFATDSCLAASLDDIRNYFEPETNFEEYWPTKMINKELLINQNSSHVNPPAYRPWTQTPPTLGLNNADNVQNSPLPSLPHPAAVPLSSMPMSMNEWPSNQLVNSYITQAQPPPPTHGYSVLSTSQNTAQYYNANLAILQQSNSNNNQMNSQPSPLVRSGGNTTTQIMPNYVPYPNVMTIASINQSMTTMYNNSMAHGNVISQSHYSMLGQYQGVQQQRPMSGGGRQFQEQQQQQLQQQQSYRQQMMNLEGNVVSSNPRIDYTQQRTALRTIVTPPASEIIDLSSPPSSPDPSAVASPPPADTVSSLELQIISEHSSTPGTSHSMPYKIQQATLQGKMIKCINVSPYNYSEIMVTLEDLVQTLFPSVTVERCAQILTKYLNVTLYRGNNDQMAVLQVNNHMRYSDDAPMAMLNDVTHVLLQLIDLVHKQDEQIQQFSVSSPVKRQRFS